MARVHPEHKRAILAGFYYACLNQDAGFRGELANLFAAMTGACQDRPLGLAENPEWATPDYVARIEQAAARAAATFPEHARPRQRIEADFSLARSRLAVQRQASAFAERHPLPSGAARDLTFSFAGRTHFGGRLVRCGGWGAIEGQPMELMLPALPALSFDPTTETRAQLQHKLDEVFRRVAEHARHQADEVERRAGLVEWGYKPTDRPTLEIGAKRLYLRAWQGLGWAAIAADEGHIDLRSVKLTTNRWARNLGVTLPVITPRNLSR